MDDYDPVSAALRVLLDVCRRMDAENQDERPTESEYQAAIAMGYRALADAAVSEPVEYSIDTDPEKWHAAFDMAIASSSESSGEGG